VFVAFASHLARPLDSQASSRSRTSTRINRLVVLVVASRRYHSPLLRKLRTYLHHGRGIRHPASSGSTFVHRTYYALPGY